MAKNKPAKVYRTTFQMNIERKFLKAVESTCDNPSAFLRKAAIERIKRIEDEKPKVQ
jgi:hypothetical protein